MLKGLQTIEDIGTFVLSLEARYKCGQREPGGCGTGAEKWLQPQLQSCGRGDGAPGNTILRESHKSCSQETIPGETRNRHNRSNSVILRQKKKAGHAWALVSILWGTQ